MREYPVNGRTHKVYDSKEEVPVNINYKDWNKAKLGDWVLADDGCVLQILRTGTMFRSKGKVRNVDYIGTCTGTFLVDGKMKMDASPEYIQEYAEATLKQRKNLTGREELFVHNIRSRMSLTEAYIGAFKTNNKRYAETRGMLLLKTNRVKNEMKKDLEPILEKLAINEEMVLGGIRDIALSAEKDSDRLKALTELSEVLDIKDKGNKVQEIAGIASSQLFSGFDEGDIKNAVRQELGE